KSANIKITNYGPPYVWQDTIALEPGVPWIQTQNAAQYGGASWDNFVKRKARLTVQKAKQIAGLDPTITYFFFMNETMVLGGKPKPGGNTFNPGDAVFFSGKPWYGSAPQADAYKKGTTLTVIRQDYLDYTGAYVFHCHILAHEDRGMMQNVQTVCPKTGNFGTPVLSGQPDNCSEAVGILPTCPPSPYAMAQ
ncbi:MAG: multicopper oxidase domain-containing protein, partial [SAR324 cluster bacterium]|nr:multicopper oxidase domain-containing protein [SAR324 cluster bacterium]